MPAIVRWPGKVAKGEVSDVLMSQIDWIASLGALVGARLPKDAAPDSRDRLGNLLGTDQTDRPWIIEFSSGLSVCTKDWKYIEPNDGSAMITWGPKVETGNCPIPQLYDMRTGDDEKENLSAKHPEKVFELQTILRKVRRTPEREMP